MDQTIDQLSYQNQDQHKDQTIYQHKDLTGHRIYVLMHGDEIDDVSVTDIFAIFDSQEKAIRALQRETSFPIGKYEHFYIEPWEIK